MTCAGFASPRGKVWTSCPWPITVRFSEMFGEDVFQITAQASVAARDNPGGTAPNRVAYELDQAQAVLSEAGYGV